MASKIIQNAWSKLPKKHANKHNFWVSQVLRFVSLVMIILVLIL